MSTVGSTLLSEQGPNLDYNIMVSKRNSRVFIEESPRQEESCTKIQKAQLTSYRSRRNSRSSGKDELQALAEDVEEGLGDSTSSSDSDISISRSQSGASLVRATTIEPIQKATDLNEPSTLRKTLEDYPAPPLTGRPHNFGVVIPGVYRSSYPRIGDFEYLKGLKLKTVVTLVKKDTVDNELQSFVTANGIHQIIFNMKGTKKQAIPLATMKSILEVVLDRRNYPLMIHCNHGKHRTGCVVAVVRKMAGWNASTVLDEYRAYAEPKIRDCDVAYIKGFQTSTLHPLTANHIQSRYTPLQIRSFRRTLLFSTVIMLLWVVSGTQMMSTRSRLAN